MGLKMIVLYIIGGYIVVSYVAGAIIFRANGNSHAAAWGGFYFTFSPITVPMVLWCIITD